MRNGWLDGVKICVPLVRHPPGTPGRGVEVGVVTGVGVAVFVGGFPAAIAVLEGNCNKVSRNTPTAMMVKLTLNFRIISFLLIYSWRSDRAG